MRYQSLLISAAVFIATLFIANPSSAQPQLRFGVWDNSTNPNNVMTYEAFEKGGSKLTVSNPSNPSKDWSYVTMFDGKFRRSPVSRAPKPPSRSSTRRASASRTSGTACCTRW